MGTASIYFDSWSLRCREFLRKLVPHCDQPGCVRARSLWYGVRPTGSAVLLGGRHYCLDGCLESALLAALANIHFSSGAPPIAHRIPLGLLLLSRQQVTEEQLRTALETQRTAGHGRIGDWLQTLGFVSESQVTAALARQWSCPVLRGKPMMPEARRAPQIPLTLLESFAMIPVDYIPATSTLHVAFGEGIDYGVLYAIEQMAGCHTEVSMAVPSLVRRHLQILSEHGERSEVVFDQLADHAEFSRIIRSYCLRVAASEILLSSCGAYLWVRLLRRSRPPFDLLLRSSR